MMEVVNAGSLLLVILIIIPVLGALACLALRSGPFIRLAVGVNAVVLSASSLFLFAYLAAAPQPLITVTASELYPMGPAIILLGYLLIAVFIYIGWRARSYWVIGFAILEALFSTFVELGTGWQEADPSILVDYLSLLLTLITCLVGSVIAIYSLRYMRNDAHQARFFAVTLLFLGSMNGAVFSNDLLWLLFFWEVTTLCSFLLIGHTGTEEAKKAAIRALIITSGGGAALALGALVALNIYGGIGLNGFPIEGLGSLALFPLILLSIGAFTKSAQVPFQGWLVGAMVAPTPVSALLHSSTMVNLGVYLLLRLSPSIAVAPSISWLIALVGGASFLATALLAMTQGNSKRLLAYSTVLNLGLIVMCVGIATPLAITAGLILLLYHAISKALLFLSVGVVKEELATEEIEGMVGLRSRMPFISLAIFVGAITIVLPPFGMFASKWLVSEAVITFPFLAFLLAAGFAAIIVFFFKWVGNILSTGPDLPEDQQARGRVAPVYGWTLGSLIVAALGLSILIGPVVQYLLDPFLMLHFSGELSSNAFSLFSRLGEFPVVIFLILAAFVFLGLSVLVRPSPGTKTTPYACGETFNFQPGGNYYLTEGQVDYVRRVSEAATAILLIVLLLVPLFLEVV